MPHCPVCQSRYTNSNRTEYCPVCGWDLRPYTLIVALMPEVFQKEKSRLEWAKSIWARSKPRQDQLQTLQLKLEAADATQQQLKAQLQLSQQSQQSQSQTLQQREADLQHLRSQLDLAQQELTYLHGQFDQANQERAELLQILQSRTITPPSPLPDSRSRSSEARDLQETPIEQESPAPKSPALSSQVPDSQVPDSQVPDSQVPDSPAASSPAASSPAPSSPAPSSPETVAPEIAADIVAPAIASPENLSEGMAIDATDTENSGTKIVAAESSHMPASEVNPLPQLHFTIVIVDAQGKVCDRRSGQAAYWIESLGQVALEMVQVPAGKFPMGSPETEAERERHETPQHQVSVAAFGMSRFPITQAQWRFVANLTAIDRSLSPAPSFFQGNDLPIERISWYEATEFCVRLSRFSGRHYRLPTEAEWEYACRAGTTTPFHFGETIAANLANYDGNDVYSAGTPGQYFQRTTPVGSFQVANAFGFSDMHGNVWEWCADDWHEDYRGAPIDGTAWLVGNGERYRVLRGGAWYCLPGLCRSAQRHWDQADHSGSGIGFRVVCAID